MKKNVITLLYLLSGTLAFSQVESSTNFNFGFEQNTKSTAGLADDWFIWGTPTDYLIRADSTVKYDGKFSVLIESKKKGERNSFGCAAYKIPAAYEGKEIEVKAYMKFDQVTKGAVGILLRIDGDAGMLGFDNMIPKNIHGSKDWTQYSVKLPLPKEATKINIGAILTGDGRLWADHFEILIDGKDIRKAKTKELKKYKAEEDTEFDLGSSINSIPLTASKVEDLVVLGKTWGFLKYYHPAVAKGDYNWDYELFRIAPKIIQSKDAAERNELLHNWVKSFGEVEIEKERSTKEIVKLTPDLEWINKEQLGEQLYTQLTNLVHAKRANENYYIAFVPNVANPIFKNENPYNKFPYPDAGYRLLSLFRYWNIIQYYFPYKKLTDKNWNWVLPELLTSFISASNELEYKQAVLKLIANVQDTHANILGNDAALSTYFGKNYAPIKVAFIENKAVVTGYFDKELGASSGLQIGDVIEKLNDRSVSEIIKNVLPLTPASNYPTQLRNIARSILRTNDSTLRIEYSHKGDLKTTQLVCIPKEKINVGKWYSNKDTCFKLINPDISYIYPGTIKNEYLPKFMPDVLKTKGLIIDLRCYPSEFIVFTLGKYLLPEKTNFVKFSTGSITTPGLFIEVV